MGTRSPEELDELFDFERQIAALRATAVREQSEMVERLPLREREALEAGIGHANRLLGSLDAGERAGLSTSAPSRSEDSFYTAAPPGAPAAGLAFQYAAAAWDRAGLPIVPTGDSLDYYRLAAVFGRGASGTIEFVDRDDPAQVTGHGEFLGVVSQAVPGLERHFPGERFDDAFEPDFWNPENDLLFRSSTSGVEHRVPVANVLRIDTEAALANRKRFEPTGPRDPANATPGR